MKNLYLTSNEEKAIRLLADGRSSAILLEECEIPISGLGVFTYELRRKTGIENTRRPSDCQYYLKQYAKAFENPPQLSVEQKDAARLLMGGATIKTIATRISRSLEQGVAIMDSTLVTAGIFSKDLRTQRSQLRLFMAVFYLRKNVCEDIGPLTWDILRAVARGEHYTNIALKHSMSEEYTRSAAHAGLTKLGFVTRGRGTQEGLLRGYMEYLDAQAAEAAQDPMNDPLL